MSKHTAEIIAILNNTYGVGGLHASPTTILWAAEKCENPRLSLNGINAYRRRYGRVPAHAPYGHVAF